MSEPRTWRSDRSNQRTVSTTRRPPAGRADGLDAHRSVHPPHWAACRRRPFVPSSNQPSVGVTAALSRPVPASPERPLDRSAPSTGGAAGRRRSTALNEDLMHPRLEAVAPTRPARTHVVTGNTVADPGRAAPSPAAVAFDTTVIVPTFNEGGNVDVLVRRLAAALPDTHDVEVLFVDDSTDDTPERIRAVGLRDLMPVRLLHRGGPGSGPAAWPGRSGRHRGPPTPSSSSSWTATCSTRRSSSPSWRVAGDADLAVASRYVGEGDSAGLRRLLAPLGVQGPAPCWPELLPAAGGQGLHRPMTGFFCFRRDAVDLSRLRPRGFKILLEILARHDLERRRAAVLLRRAQRRGQQGLLAERAALPVPDGQPADGADGRFAAVGALGTVVNLAVMWVLVHVARVRAAAVVAAEPSILHNFLMQERFVFRDMRDGVTASRPGSCSSSRSTTSRRCCGCRSWCCWSRGWGCSRCSPRRSRSPWRSWLRFFFVSHVVYAAPVPHRRRHGRARGWRPDHDRSLRDARARRPGAPGHRFHHAVVADARMALARRLRVGRVPEARQGQVLVQPHRPVPRGDRGGHALHGRTPPGAGPPRLRGRLLRRPRRRQADEQRPEHRADRREAGSPLADPREGLDQLRRGQEQAEADEQRHAAGLPQRDRRCLRRRVRRRCPACSWASTGPSPNAGPTSSRARST